MGRGVAIEQDSISPGSDLIAVWGMVKPIRILRETAQRADVPIIGRALAALAGFTILNGRGWAG